MASSLILEDELLPDPFGDRRCSDVPRPPNKRLQIDRLYSKKKDDGSQAPNDELIKAY